MTDNHGDGAKHTAEVRFRRRNTVQVIGPWGPDIAIVGHIDDGHAACRDARRLTRDLAGHRSRDIDHDCFAMNCRALGDDVESLRAMVIEATRLERQRIYMALVDRLWGCDADANAVLDIVEDDGG